MNGYCVKPVPVIELTITKMVIWRNEMKEQSIVEHCVEPCASQWTVIAVALCVISVCIIWESLPLIIGRIWRFFVGIVPWLCIAICNICTICNMQYAWQFPIPIKWQCSSLIEMIMVVLMLIVNTTMMYDNEYVDGWSHPVIHHGLIVCRDGRASLKRYKFVFA